jgi:hypothetical protein
VVFAAGWLFSKLAEYKVRENEDLQTKVQPLQAREQQFNRAFSQFKNTTNDLGQLAQWIQDRYYWADTLAELRRVFTRVEAGTRQRLGSDTGVWIERMISLENLGGTMDSMGGMFTPGGGFGGYPGAPAYPGYPGGPGPGMMREFDRPMIQGEDVMGGAPPPAIGPDGMPMDPAAAGAAGAPASTDISKVTMVCRGVDMSRVDSSANAAIAYALEAELRQSPLFTTNTALVSPITDDPTSSTFSFTISLEMNRPLKQ